MRLHRLLITAFGPFAEQQEVDFDELAGSGLFLLHGPTGAGKTSVLDAICFALYGRVPGVRGSVGRLRSDHAAACVSPEVVLDFTVAGRRFEVTRSPEWQRPKKRGSGTVREQTHVVLRERVRGEWIGLTSRVDEAADLLHQLIGLGPEQFTKLILLPQGDFAAFLQASAEERRPLLQKLFGTDRFAEVERWLADRRRESEHQVQAAAAITARLFSRAQEARLAPPPGLGSGSDSGLDEPGDVEAALVLVRGWAGFARSQLLTSHAEVGVAEKAHDRARRVAQTVTEAIRRRDRQLALATELEELLVAEPVQVRRRAAIAAAAHAPVLIPLLTELDDAQRQNDLDAERWVSAETAVLRAGEDPQAVTPERVSALREELGSLAELLSAQAELSRLDSRHAAGEREIAAAQDDQAAAAGLLLELTARREELGAGLTGLDLLAAALADRDQDLTRATAVARAVLELQQLAEQRTGLDDELRAAIDAHQDAVAVSQELRARRLDGMAAELAAGLDGGRPCPVCGSAEHPQPARQAGPAVTRAAQEQAENAEAAAAASRETARQAVEVIAQRVAAVSAVADGCDLETAAQALRTAEQRVVEARSASTRAAELGAEMATLLTRIERTGTQELTARTRAAAGREELAALDGRRTDLRERLDRARGEDDDVRARHRRLSTAAAALAECEAARTAATRAGERLTRAQAAADNAAKAAGFVNRAAAEAAALPEPERRRLAELVAEHEARVSRVRALLEELEAENAADAEQGRHDGAPDSEAEVPQLSVAELMSASMTMTPFAEQLSMFADEDAPVPAAAPVPESITEPMTAAGTAVESAAPSQPDLEAELERLQTALALARAEHEAARERHTLAARAVRALTGLGDELERHAKATRPVRRNFATVDSVSKCVEGTGGDNTLRMRLSSYVLAARLEQVADAASLRLASMSGGRYTLVHTDGPSRAGARSGLGLAVIDGWTGVQRDPASLSGGETFCTSLALALGLADVVQAEAGGAVIETLLVDEGFGSLDEDTLDEVMDVLDGLRSAGRAVGLVSHVSDLRDRIPAQLEVVKTRTGSRLIA